MKDRVEHEVASFDFFHVFHRKSWKIDFLDFYWILFLNSSLRQESVFADPLAFNWPRHHVPRSISDYKPISARIWDKFLSTPIFRQNFSASDGFVAPSPPRIGTDRRWRAAPEFQFRRLWISARCRKSEKSIFLQFSISYANETGTALSRVKFPTEIPILIPSGR